MPFRVANGRHRTWQRSKITTQAEAFKAIKAAVWLRWYVILAHLQDDKLVCVFSDASSNIWGAILTQVTTEDYEPGSSPTLWAHVFVHNVVALNN